VPTPDPFIPLVYFGALAAAIGATPEVLVDDHAFGSLSMTCFTLHDRAPSAAPPAGAAPPRSTAPPDQTNL
jgi:hypothetical protein